MYNRLKQILLNLSDHPPSLPPLPMQSPVSDAEPVVEWGPCSIQLGREVSIMHTILTTQLKAVQLSEVRNLPRHMHWQTKNIAYLGHSEDLLIMNYSNKPCWQGFFFPLSLQLFSCRVASFCFASCVRTCPFPPQLVLLYCNLATTSYLYFHSCPPPFLACSSLALLRCLHRQ